MALRLTIDYDENPAQALFIGSPGWPIRQTTIGKLLSERLRHHKNLAFF